MLMSAQVVRSRANGKYDLRYAGGELEHNVPRDSIRVRGALVKSVDPLQGLEHVQEYLRTYSASLLDIDGGIGKLKASFDLTGDERGREQEREEASASATMRLDGHSKEVIRARRDILEKIRKNIAGDSGGLLIAGY
jgi:hypothetical protein